MEMIKIFREPCYLKPFITLNVLFLLMTFSGKFAVEMYALDILEEQKPLSGSSVQSYYSVGLEILAPITI